MAIHPNSVKNLGPAWTSETAPRNNGRPKGSLAPSEALKMLSGKSADEVQQIYEDPSANLVLRSAARLMLVSVGEISDVRPRDAQAAFDALADRMEGKPRQITQISATIGDERPAIIDVARWEASFAGPDQKQIASGEFVNHDQN